MKCQAICSLKEGKQIILSSAAVAVGALRANMLVSKQVGRLIMIWTTGSRGTSL